jgi:flagellar motor switch protein FliG
VRRNMFVFEDIVQLDDRSIQRVLREVDSRDLVLALKGSNEEVRQAVFRNLSSRAAQTLREDLEALGPVRLRNVEEAQQRIVNVIRKLEEAEEIVIARGSQDELIV